MDGFWGGPDMPPPDDPVSIRTIDYVLAAAGMLGHLTLLAVLVRRHLLSRLPIFAILIAFYFLRSALLLAGHFPAGWLPYYWILIYLDPGLQLLLILTLGRVAWRFGRTRIALAVPLLMVVSSMVAWYAGPSSHSSLQNLSLKLGLFISTMWLLVTPCLFMLLRKADLYARVVPLGIALGFAVYSAANVATEIVQKHFALHPQPAIFTGLSLFRAIIYLCCLAGWSILFLSDKSKAAPALT
jgi:hypothetical protein